jgi:hypothetical protein
MRILAALTAALSIACATAPVGAQQVWRCGPDGRVFSDRPCADGHAIAAGDRRTAEEIDAAREVASREQKLADSLASERAQRAKVAPGAGLIAIGPLEEELQAERREREIKRQRASKKHSGKRHPRRSGAGI